MKNDNYIYLDCEVTHSLFPELLSLGMVTADGHEHFIQYGVQSGTRPTAHAPASKAERDEVEPVRSGGFSDGACSRQQMGEGTASWLLAQVVRLGQPVVVAHNGPPGYEHLTDVIRGAGQWGVVSGALRPRDVHDLTGTFESNMVAGEAFERMRKRGFPRHHALAEAHGLRAACVAVLTGKRVQP